MPVSQEKSCALAEWMAELGICEADLVEKFVLGSGKGGQKINKTSSSVYLKHLPTGIEVKCQRTRSRELNRYLARRALCEKIAALRFQAKSAQQEAHAKIRRQKKRRSRRLKEKLVEDKRTRGEVKKGRSEVKEG